MKRGAAIVTSVAALIAAPHGVAADEGRFDAQVFRPLAAPRDLVMVPKSEVIGHLSPVVGVYWDAALDPLALALGDTGRTLHAVGARLQITPILGIGLVDWVELSMAVPFVAWQTSDNLRSIGTEGEVKSTPKPINFEADTTIITDASKLVLESVARVLHERPDILLVEIQGHTDVRESDIRSLLLSGRRMKSVMQYLIDHGVSSSRLEAKGYGARHPIENDKGCLGPDEDLTPRCREATSKNRRVVFLIKSLGTPRPTPIVGGDPDKASLLPSGAHVLPMGAAVLSACKKEDSSSTGCSVLTKEGVLKKDTVLGKPNTILPSEPSLPSGGNILPKGGSNLPRK